MPEQHPQESAGLDAYVQRQVADAERRKRDREDADAALRAGTLGWRAYWYRGGMEAWTANGLPTAPVKPATGK
jgi:rhodanese-related sulfurtransferase